MSSLRVAAKAQERLYASLAADGQTTGMLDEMQSRAELYDLIGLSDFEALDKTLVQSVAPVQPPRRD